MSNKNKKDVSKKDISKSNTKLCLNMIVKNEAHLVEYKPITDEKIPVIKRCLDNIGHLIDAIAIVDTGSNDKTIEIIEKWAEEHQIPCQVKIDQWRDDFGYSRTVALRHGQVVIDKIKNKDLPNSPDDLDSNTSWYFMFMDADNLVWSREGNKLFQLDKKSLTLDAYRIPMRMANVEYAYTFLVKADPQRPWHWYYPVHEYVSEMKDQDGKSLWTSTYGVIENGYVDSRREGSRSHNPMKYLNDAIAFEKHLLSNPFDERDLYYMAQSYRDAGREFGFKVNQFQEQLKNPQLPIAEKRNLELKIGQFTLLLNDMFERAEKTYIIRATAPPFNMWKDEYTYCAWYEASRIRRARKGRFDQKTINYLFKAYNVRPQRLEAPHDLLVYYRSIEAWTTGWLLAKELINNPYPKDDIIFVDKDIHCYKFYFEASVCAYYSGNKSEFVRLSNKVLKYPHISEEIRKLAESNLEKYGKEFK